MVCLNLSPISVGRRGVIEPQAGDAYRNTQPAEIRQRYDSSYLLNRHKHKPTIKYSIATEGKLMEPGLGTNPRSSGERCWLGEPTRSRTTRDAGLPWAKRKRAKSEVSQWRPAGFWPVADATDPYRTSRIPTHLLVQDFYLPSLHVEEGGGNRRPVCVPDQSVSKTNFSATSSCNYPPPDCCPGPETLVKDDLS